MKNQDRHGEFEQVVLPHLDAAYNLARWLTRNDDDAQDIAQEASLRALKFFDGFHGENARAWLLTIVRNTYYTWLQKSRDRNRDESFDEEFHGIEGDGPTFAGGMPQSDPEQLMMQQASQQLVNKALEQLPVDSREIIVLRELEDLSYKDIANIVKIPMGTVMSRLAHARKLLRERIEQMDEHSKIEAQRRTSKFARGTNSRPGPG